MRADRVRQRGSSLIEFMVASVLGLIAISVIGGVFITGQKITKEKSLELLLLQNLTSTMQVMKEDILRAGFDGENGHSLKLSGAISTVELSGSSALGFVYFKEGSPSSKDYRHIVYKKSGDKLQACEKGTTTPIDVLSFPEVTSCYSLFDDKVISVDEFEVSSSVVSLGSVQSNITDVAITASIPDVGLSESITISVKQRNWQ